ncbi:MAG TPA: endonuclease/exonuclease/phosphatase family protein [Noviherbaspirillum sp.]
MKLLTWNIQWGRGADGRVDLDRIVAHAKRFSDFDVLCLQEVSAGYPDLPGNDGADQFAGIAERLPGYSAIAGIATDVPDGIGGRRRFGNMILSRFPVQQVFRHLLPWPAEVGVRSMQRVAVEASLDTPMGPVRVTTTHLEYYSTKQRRAQIERLRLLHQEACAHARTGASLAEAEGPFSHPPRASAAILTGDFNFLPDSPDRMFMTSPIDAATPAYRDAWRIAHPAQAHAPTVGVYDKVQWPGPPFTFDFVFVSEDLAERVQDVRVDPVSDASDHQPVLVEFRT